MRKRVRNLFIRLNIYNSVKYSFLFRIYVGLFKPHVIEEEKKEIRFYRSFLKDCRLVFDIGAYDGHKTAAFITMSERVLCIEPDPFNFRILKTRFKGKKGVMMKQVAVSDQLGVAPFFVHHPGSAFNTLHEKWKGVLQENGKQLFNEDFAFPDKAGEVPVTTLDRLIEQYGCPDFIKIDVEGYEEFVLKGLSVRVKYLSIEANFPYFFGETISCLKKMDELDSGAVYNYSLHEELELPEFISFQDFVLLISKPDFPSCEIICKSFL